MLPSRAEGLSNSLLEYMAAGRPIVATVAGGNGELIDNEIQGLLIPPEDPQPLAKAVMRLLDSPEVRISLHRAVCSRVSRDYSAPSMVQRHEAFYHNCAHSNRMRTNDP